MSDWSQMVEDCERRDHLLTNWERKFIDSIGHCLGDGRGLSPGQAAKLDEVWSRVTDLEPSA